MCKAGKNELIYVSYGAKEQTGTDLYVNKANVNVTSGSSQLLGPDINTPLDDNYPYVTKDGKTLYFSSKGHNSMGGYDIFKCTRADTATPWSKPQNMGFPINSTYDDILYIPDTANRYASFCTNRKNERFEYMQIKIPENALAYSIIKGNFSCSESTNNKNAIITVFNSNNNEIAGVFKTNGETGNYLMVLFSDVNYNMTIEADGYTEMTNEFSIPEKKGDFIVKQTIKLAKENSQNTIKVNNYFTEEQANTIAFEDKVAKREFAKPIKEPASKKEVLFVHHNRSPEETATDNQNLKHARSLYDQNIYQEAALIYHELDVYIELVPIQSYYYGLCLYHSKKDKLSCIQLLETASTSKDVPVDVFYYLGMAHHLSYKFSSAITSVASKLVKVL